MEYWSIGVMEGWKKLRLPKILEFHCSITPTLQSPLFQEITGALALLNLLWSHLHLNNFAPKYLQSLCY